MTDIQLLKPSMPSTEALLPWLRQIDQNQHYTNAGPLLQAFKAKLSTLLSGLSSQPIHTACTSSGTLALELSLRSLNLKQGAKVLVPAYTFIASAIAIVNAGLTPVIVDVCPQRWQLTPDLARDYFSQIDNIAAIMPVATFGAQVSMSAWSELSREHDIPVVIDAAGAFANEAIAENLLVCYSLHATKSFGIGEGGLIASTDSARIQAIKVGTNFGLERGEVKQIGTNAKLSEYHAAVGLAQCTRWPSIQKKLLDVREPYLTALRAQVPGKAHEDEFICGNLLAWEFPVSRSPYELALQKANIPFRAYYHPLIQAHPAFSNEDSMPTPNATALSERILCLPFHTELSEKQIAMIISTLALA